jgi:hypothetical protein
MPARISDFRGYIRSRCAVDASTKCWHWAGYVNHNGYGMTGAKTPVGRLAHRISFWAFGGTLQSGELVCHSCDNPSCVNPQHLFSGTQSDNMTDCSTKGRHWAAKMTHCQRGHPLSGENVRTDSKGFRACVTCARASTRMAMRKRRANHVAGGAR